MMSLRLVVEAGTVSSLKVNADADSVMVAAAGASTPESAGGVVITEPWQKTPQ